MEDVKVREMQIFDYKKKIAEADTKLKQQQVSVLGPWPLALWQHSFFVFCFGITFHINLKSQ